MLMVVGISAGAAIWFWRSAERTRSDGRS